MKLSHVSVVSIAVFMMTCSATRSDEMPSRAGASEEPERPIIRLGDAKAPLAIAFGSDGGKLVTCTRSTSVGVWNPADGRLLLRIADHADGLFPVGVAMSGDGRRIVTGGPAIYEEEGNLLRVTPRRSGSLVKLWDAESGRLIKSFSQGNTHYFSNVAVNRSASLIACADYMLNTILWDGSNGKVIASVDGPASCAISYGPCSTMFSADATRFAAIAVNLADERSHLPYHQNTRTLYLCDLSDGRAFMIPPMPERGTEFGTVALSGDGKEVAVWRFGAPAGQELVTFDFKTGRIIAKLPAPGPDECSYLAYSPDNSTIALGKTTGKVSLLDRVTGVRIAELTSGPGPIRAIAFKRGSVLVVSESSETKASNELRAENRNASLEVREHTIPPLRP
ncbi:hypothetical protein V5E97_25975 [Singulisphaera sp. Ch08]|uniref:WD40 repeat domain-containing protein n=1 Tax=Singulisphaera sp. Ch08 TaxID=3120278 RepID=A0AAU7C9H4_9BACT